MEFMDCRTKYIKYKTKYIGLKNKIQYGGSEKRIFHVSGANFADPEKPL